MRFLLITLLFLATSASAQIRTELSEWLTKDIAGGKLRVWVRKSPGDQRDLDLAASALEDVYAREVALFGREPLPDNGFQTNLDLNTSRAVDVYLIKKPPMTMELREAVTKNADKCNGTLNALEADVVFRGYNCYVILPGSAATSVREPRGQGSGWMYLDRGDVGTPSFKNSVAHEMFHLLQYSFNHTAILRGDDPHWFAEASAEWMAAYIMRGDKAGLEPAHERWPGYYTKLPPVNSAADPTDGYAAWVWPLFMEQEAGVASIKKAWENIAGVKSFEEIDGAVDRAFSFEKHFQDFAVRVLNQRLMPGDPLGKHFADLDTLFPADGPGPAGHSLRPQAAKEAPLKVTLPPIPALVMRYLRFTVEKGVREVSIDMSELNDTGPLDVDVLLKVRGTGPDSGWKRREKIDKGLLQLCFDDPTEDVEEIILIAGNHAYQKGPPVSGDLKVTSRAQGCSGWTGSVTITRKQSRSRSLKEENQVERVDEQAEGQATIMVRNASTESQSSVASIRNTQREDSSFKSTSPALDNQCTDFVTTATSTTTIYAGGMGEASVDLRALEPDPSGAYSVVFHLPMIKSHFEVHGVTMTSGGCGDSDHVPLRRDDVQDNESMFPLLPVVARGQIDKRAPDRRVGTQTFRQPLAANGEPREGETISGEIVQVVNWSLRRRAAAKD